MQNENNNLILKEDLVAIARNSRNNSVCNDKIKVSGEYYATKNKNKKNKITASKAKITALAIAVIALITVGVKIVGNGDFITEVRHEAAKTHTVFNPIGGKYTDEYVYGEDFVKYIQELSDSELNQLYDQITDKMRDEGLIEESKDQSEVISNMHSDYQNSLGGISR